MSKKNDLIEHHIKVTHCTKKKILLIWLKLYAIYIQYDGSKDDLDWRIDFRYLNFI